MTARFDARCCVNHFEAQAQADIADVTDSSMTACLNSTKRVDWSFISLAHAVGNLICSLSLRRTISDGCVNFLERI